MSFLLDISYFSCRLLCDRYTVTTWRTSAHNSPQYVCVSAVCVCSSENRRCPNDWLTAYLTECNGMALWIAHNFSQVCAITYIHIDPIEKIAQASVNAGDGTQTLRQKHEWPVAHAWQKFCCLRRIRIGLTFLTFRFFRLCCGAYMDFLPFTLPLFITNTDERLFFFTFSFSFCHEYVFFFAYNHGLRLQPSAAALRGQNNCM